MKTLNGKNCLITGAASGIGRTLAIGLAKEGMNLFLSDFDMEGLENVKKEVAKSRIQVFTGKCDVSKLEDYKKLTDQAAAQMGDVDLLINNAGIAGAGLIEDLGPEDWKHVMDVNALTHRFRLVYNNFRIFFGWKNLESIFQNSTLFVSVYPSQGLRK